MRNIDRMRRSEKLMLSGGHRQLLIEAAYSQGDFTSRWGSRSSPAATASGGVAGRDGPKK